MPTDFNWHFHAYRRFRHDLPDSRGHFKTEGAFGSRSPDHGHCIDFGRKSGFWSKCKFITTTDYSPAGSETPVENVRISEELTVSNSVATTTAASWSPFSFASPEAVIVTKRSGEDSGSHLKTADWSVETQLLRVVYSIKLCFISGLVIEVCSWLEKFYSRQ